MPCDQLRTISLDMSQATPHVLKAALEALGFRVEESRYNGSLTIYDKTGNYAGSWTKGSNLNIQSRYGEGLPTQEQIQDAYCHAAVKETQKQFALWDIKQTAPNKYKLTRGY